MAEQAAKKKLSIKENAIGAILGAIYPITGAVLFFLLLGCIDPPCNSSVVTIVSITLIPFAPGLLTCFLALLTHPLIVTLFEFFNLNSASPLLDSVATILSFIPPVILWMFIGVGIQVITKKENKNRK